MRCSRYRGLFLFFILAKVSSMKVAMMSQVLLLSPLFAVEAILTLGSGVGVNEIEINATIGGAVSDTATTTYSGTIEVALEVSDHQVSSFHMTGGKVSSSDTGFTFEVFPGTAQNVDFVDLAAAPTSLTGAEALGVPGQFSASLHVFRFNEGCLVSTGAFGDSKSLVAENPFDAAGTDLGQITLSAPTTLLSTLTSEPIATEYAASLSLPLNSTVTDASSGLSVVTVTTGTVTAEGNVLVYAHPFYEWATENAPEAGLAIAFDADANGDGVSDGLAWALGHAAGTTARLPDFSWDAVQEEFVFTLPETTRHPITLEASDDLSADGWLPLAGFDPIAPETVGELRIPRGEKNTRFFRFSSSL